MNIPEALKVKLVELLELNDSIRADYEQKVAELEGKLQEQLTKTASTAAVTVPQELVEKTAEALTYVGVFTKKDKAEVISRLTSDPTFAFTCLEKLAAIEKDRKDTVVPLGRVVKSRPAAGDYKCESDRVWDEGIKELRQYV